MEPHFLGRSNLEVPRLGVGAMTWGNPTWFARLGPAKLAYGGTRGFADEEAAFKESMHSGVTFFDTAPLYSSGASERRLGELARGTTALIATKFPPDVFSRAEALPRSLDASLERLGRKPVDLYQHHFPSKRVPIPELMAWMAYAIKSRKVNAVGVSNYSAEEMRMAYSALAHHGFPLASNQVEYSLLHRQPEVNGVLEACRELGITLIAYMPLGSGALTGKYDSGHRPGGLRRFMKPFKGKYRETVAEIVALLREIGQRYSKTPAQVALRWLMENPIVLPIPGAKNGSQARENAGALSFSLTAEEIKAIGDATISWQYD